MNSEHLRFSGGMRSPPENRCGGDREGYNGEARQPRDTVTGTPSFYSQLMCLTSNTFPVTDRYACIYGACPECALPSHGYSHQKCEGELCQVNPIVM
jgi:hypothetical protein